MTCYLPDHLVRCLICKNLFSDARRLRCGCVYCYLCCLQLIRNYTIYCQCSSVHRFNSQDEVEKSLVIDNVVNDLVSQHIKQKQKSAKTLVDYECISTSSHRIQEDINRDDQQIPVSLSPSNLSSIARKQLAVVQPPCIICKKKSNIVILCEHCKSDICELCMEKHYQMITDMLHDKWMLCKEKFNQINEHVSLSHQNKRIAISKLDIIRKTIQERSKNLKLIIENHRQDLSSHIDNHIQNVEQIVKANDIYNEYQSMRERLPKILQEQTNTVNLASFLKETEQLLEELILRNKRLKELETKIPYLSQPYSASINLSELLGELKLDDESTEQTSSAFNQKHQIHCNDDRLPSSTSRSSEKTRFPRRMRSGLRSRGGRGVQHSSYSNEFYPRNKPNLRNNRHNSSYRARGRMLLSNSRHSRYQSSKTDFNIVPNDQYRWSLDFKEIPFFLAVLDNRNHACEPDAHSTDRYSHLLFVADDYGRIGVYGLPQTAKDRKPSIIGTGELFPKNSRLILESFTVYKFAIVAYVRRFEQRSNEIEHSKLIKAGLPIMKGEQGRCNDHGGMIYLFSHGGDEIDGIYQSHPIRAILADESLGRLWVLNPMHNHVYCNMMPNHKDEIRKCLQDEEIVLDFFEEDFEPSSMIQSDQCIGLIDSEHDAYRLYAKDDKFRLISTYQNIHSQNWKLADGIIFKDNRTLLKFIEDKSNDAIESNARNDRTRLHGPQRCLIELTADGQEKRRIQANTLHSMVLGPNDEIILGFAVRGDRGLIHCY